MNLDAYQGETNKHFNTSYNIPILFFTQLIGLALGKDPKKLGIGLELVSAKNALRKIGVEIPDESASTPRKSKRVKKEGLPMPVMPGDKEVD
jgi:heterodisulfide reductase subunit B